MVVRAPLDFYWKWGELDLHNQQYRFVIKNFILMVAGEKQISMQYFNFTYIVKFQQKQPLTG